MLQPELVKKPQQERQSLPLEDIERSTEEVKAIVVLSGGMDSATVLAYAVDLWSKENVIALTFDYGQRHSKEQIAAGLLAKHFGVRHIFCTIDLRQIGGSSLTDEEIAVPPFERDEDVWKHEHVALTYVPMRNTIFLALAAAYAEREQCTFIYTGFNYIDSGGYPDTRPEYVTAMNEVMKKGSRDKPTIAAPLIHMTKKEIVKAGENYKVPWEKTWSCYEGLDEPCGKCNACIQRRRGFEQAGIKDPLESAEPQDVNESGVVDPLV